MQKKISIGDDDTSADNKLNPFEINWKIAETKVPRISSVLFGFVEFLYCFVPIQQIIVLRLVFVMHNRNTSRAIFKKNPSNYACHKNSSANANFALNINTV